MSPRIPVGSFVVSAPATKLVVGDVAVFRPPGTAQTFVHEIIQAGPNGTYRTKGLLDTAPDPWTIRMSNVVGKVQLSIRGLGYLIESIPVFVAVGCLAWVIDWLMRGKHKSAIIALGTTLAIEAPLAIWRPLVGMQVVSLIGTHNGARAFVVSTGVLPTHMELGDGPIVSTPAGHPQVLTSPAGGQLTLIAHAALSWWGWIILVGICLFPLLAAFISEYYLAYFSHHHLNQKPNESLESHETGSTISTIPIAPENDNNVSSGELLKPIDQT